MPRIYGSIPHLPGSRAAGDKTLSPSQAARCLDPSRGKPGERVIVQEKLDGSCVGIARRSEGGALVALGREGRLAAESPNEGRRMFATWVDRNREALEPLVAAGEVLVGEWLALVHGTRYSQITVPFVPFDLMIAGARAPFDVLVTRLHGSALSMPKLLHRGAPLPLAEAIALLGPVGGHGAIDPPEGAVYRVERPDTVVLVAKWVRPEKVDGSFLPENSGQPALYHWKP